MYACFISQIVVSGDCLIVEKKYTRKRLPFLTRSNKNSVLINIFARWRHGIKIWNNILLCIIYNKEWAVCTYPRTLPTCICSDTRSLRWVCQILRDGAIKKKSGVRQIINLKINFKNHLVSIYTKKITQNLRNPSDRISQKMWNNVKIWLSPIGSNS